MNYKKVIHDANKAVKGMTRQEKDAILEHNLERERQEWEQYVQDAEWYRTQDGDVNGHE